jgi:hypothetical protein
MKASSAALPSLAPRCDVSAYTPHSSLLGALHLIPSWRSGARHNLIFYCSKSKITDGFSATGSPCEPAMAASRLPRVQQFFRLCISLHAHFSIDITAAALCDHLSGTSEEDDIQLNGAEQEQPYQNPKSPLENCALPTIRLLDSGGRRALKNL